MSRGMFDRCRGQVCMTISYGHSPLEVGTRQQSKIAAHDQQMMVFFYFPWPYKALPHLIQLASQEQTVFSPLQFGPTFTLAQTREQISNSAKSTTRVFSNSEFVKILHKTRNIAMSATTPRYPEGSQISAIRSLQPD